MHQVTLTLTSLRDCLAHIEPVQLLGMELLKQHSSQPRIFKTGAVRIVEDESMHGLSNEEVRAVLKATYPEIANATIREVTTDDGQTVVEFLPQPGRKG